MPVRIKSDRIGEFENYFGEEAIPVDMYGRRVFNTKDAENTEKAAQDIKDYYGLNTKGCRPDGGSY